jgi:hypothetical protein
MAEPRSPEARGREGLSVDEILAELHQLERRRDVEERLGVPEQEEAAGEEAIVEHLDHPPARRLVEVDEHVATEDHVHPADHGRA